MAAPTGHGLAQPSRRKFLTRPSGPAKACASIPEQRAALSASAALACFWVQRARSSGPRMSPAKAIAPIASVRYQPQTR